MWILNKPEIYLLSIGMSYLSVFPKVLQSRTPIGDEGEEDRPCHYSWSTQEREPQAYSIGFSTVISKKWERQRLKRWEGRLSHACSRSTLSALADEREKSRTLLDESSGTDTQWVMRKDLQKEEHGMDLITLFIIVVAFVVVLFLVLQSTGRLLRKVGPNQALIVSGAGGTRAFTSGWHVVIPLYQRAQIISLRLMTFDVFTFQDLSTTQGVALTVEAVTQVKVRADQESIKTAVQHFLSKRQEERENLIRHIMEGHLREIVGQLTVEDIVKDPMNVGSQMLKTVTPDMEKMGLEVISFTLRDVRDKIGYIRNMGRSMRAQIRKQADALAQSAHELGSRAPEVFALGHEPYSRANDELEKQQPSVSRGEQEEPDECSGSESA